MDIDNEKLESLFDKMHDYLLKISIDVLIENGSKNLSVYMLGNILTCMAIKYNDPEMLKYSLEVCSSFMKKAYYEERENGKEHKEVLDFLGTVPGVAKNFVGCEDINISDVIKDIVDENVTEGVTLEDLSKDIQAEYDAKKSNADVKHFEKKVSEEEFNKFFNMEDK